MNNLVERLQARAFNMGTRHVVYDELTVNLLKEAADTLLALQTQLEAAREEEDKSEQTLKLVSMDRDHHFERAETAVAQLERAHEALREIAKGGGAYSQDPWTHAVNCIDSMKAIAKEALPSAKTAQTEQQNG